MSLTAALAGESVEITVADSGAGIPPDALPRIFERFFQVDSSRSRGEQHDVGLAIVREIVRAHGGKISVRNAVGHGSEFIVQLPLVYPDASTLVRKKK